MLSLSETGAVMAVAVELKASIFKDVKYSIL